MESNSPSNSPMLKHGARLTTISNESEPNNNTTLMMMRESQVATASTPSTIMVEEPDIAVKKKAGLIRLVGAPNLDLCEAKKLVLDEEEAENGEATMMTTNEQTMEAIELESQIETHDSEYLDGANEETFTLETFESLVRNARRNNKAFLLARVTTVDPKNLTRLYYSYYSAYQINKVIFRTQPDEGLLHRMRSKNPLNNMSIVGDVHYFSITPEAFDQAWILRNAAKEKSRVMRTSVSTPLYKALQVSNDKDEATIYKQSENKNNNLSSSKTPLEELLLLQRKKSSSSLPEMIDLNRLDEMKMAFDERDNHNNNINHNDVDVDVDDADDENTNASNNDTPVIYEAKYFASDDDFLMRSDVREYFKINSIGLDDYLLFQLNRPSGQPYEMMIMGPDGQPLFRSTQPVPRGGRPRPGLRHLWGILDDGNHQSMVQGIRLGYISPLGFWLFVIIASAGGVFCGLVYVATPINFMMFGGMLCFYILLMMFFVNWETEMTAAATARAQQTRQSNTSNNNNSNNNANNGNSNNNNN